MMVSDFFCILMLIFSVARFFANDKKFQKVFAHCTLGFSLLTMVTLILKI